MSGLPIRIRQFHAADFETLYQIDQTCFPADIAFSRGELVFYLSHPRSIARVAEASGKIVGFALARVNHDRAHVLTLDVVTEFRQRKIGTRLMNRLHHEMRKQRIAVSILEVGVTNAPAQRLYQKLRYEYQETLIGYYRGREDAYRMTRVVVSC